MSIQDKFDLNGRVAIVTGGVGLLGTEFCRTLAEAGAAVAVVDLNASAAQGTADTLTKSGFKALAVTANITQPESVNAMVEKVVSEYGRLDILVNSAALDPKFDPDAQGGVRHSFALPLSYRRPGLRDPEALRGRRA
jgi:2-deoxy-D-gluconate 3-dehydrogenase